MKATILLNHNADTRKVEEEEKSQFLLSILEQCFENDPVLLQIKELWSSAPNNILPAPQKISLRQILNIYNLQVVDDNDGNLKIFLENSKVAEWFKATYKIKRDYGAVDPKKKFFLEMAINFWSIFEDIDQAETEEIIENNKEP